MNPLVELVVVVTIMLVCFFLVFFMMFLLALFLAPIERGISKIIWDATTPAQVKRTPQTSFKDFSKKAEKVK